MTPSNAISGDASPSDETYNLQKDDDNFDWIISSNLAKSHSNVKPKEEGSSDKKDSSLQKIGDFLQNITPSTAPSTENKEITDVVN